MGMDVDLLIYGEESLIAQLKALGVTDLHRARRILETCGFFAEGRYIVVNNEHADGYNPAYIVDELLVAAFGIEEDRVFYPLTTKYGITYVDKYDVARTLDIRLDDDEEDDD